MVSLTDSTVATMTRTRPVSRCSCCLVVILTTMKLSTSILLLVFCAQASSFAFVAKNPLRLAPRQASTPTKRPHSCSTGLAMVDDALIQGAAIAVAGLAAGIGLVAFTEAQGERAKARGGGLSESMSTRIAGSLLEDVEVSSVDDLGSLTSQLEKALKESGGAQEEELEMSEADKKRLEEEADDGW